MSALALMELQRALFAKLSADSTLMSLVGGVYDNVPQNTPLPYVIIGDGTQVIRPADGLVISECQLEIHVYTDSGGRKSALEILNRLHALLHLGTLSLTGFQLISLRAEQAATLLAEQGAQFKGTMHLFVAIAEV